MIKGNLGLKPRIHPEVLEEIGELLEDGITPHNVSRYLGVSYWAVAYHFRPEIRARHELSVKKWNEKNSEKKAKYMADYQKKVREKLKHEQNIC